MIAVQRIIRIASSTLASSPSSFSAGSSSSSNTPAATASVAQAQASTTLSNTPNHFNSSAATSAIASSGSSSRANSSLSNANSNTVHLKYSFFLKIKNVFFFLIDSYKYSIKYNLKISDLIILIIFLYYVSNLNHLIS